MGGGAGAFTHTLYNLGLIMEQVRKFYYKGEFTDVDLASCKTIRDCAREFLRVSSFVKDNRLEMLEAHTRHDRSKCSGENR